MLGLCLASSVLRAEADPKAFFETTCTACHSIGEGRKIGPDLKGVETRKDRAWLIKFINDPGGVVASGDPYAKKIFDEAGGIQMPNLPGLSPELAGQLLDYIGAQSQGATGGSAADAQKEKEEAEAKQNLFLVGRNLFLGKKSRAKNAPACLACHELNGISKFPGGNFASNLSFAFTDLNGRDNAIKWFANPLADIFSAQVLRDIHQLSEEESSAVVSYLEKAEEMPYDYNPYLRMRFALVSLGGAVIVGLIIGLRNAKKNE